MAIVYLNFEIIKQLLPRLPARPAHMVAMGYPDMMISRAQVRGLFGNDVASAVRYREDSAAIIKWHKMGDHLEGIIEARHFFSLIGIEVTFLDITNIRGFEIVQDLNAPLQPGLAGRFDIVFDGGTLEHCFNVGQVMQNFLSLAKVGGFIYHNNPLNVGNHGFFNFSPTFYHDFYIDNGHQLAAEIVAYTNKGLVQEATKLPPTQRFNQNMLPESWISVLARRMNDKPPAWPLQTKYKKSATLGT